MAEKKKNESLSDNLRELNKISEWFSGQQEIDIELGLEKVKTASQLLKSSREKLNKLENEFKEIEKEIAQEENKEEADDSIPF